MRGPAPGTGCPGAYGRTGLIPYRCGFNLSFAFEFSAGSSPLFSWVIYTIRSNFEDVFRNDSKRPFYVCYLAHKNTPERGVSGVKF